MKYNNDPYNNPDSITNPYIPPVVPPVQEPAPAPGEMPAIVGNGGGGGGGGGGVGPGGPGWANKMYSPEFLRAMKGMYGAYDEAIGGMPSLADMYSGYLEGSPELEQMEYNRALARMRGQAGASRQGLTTSMAGMRGGAGSGAYAGGLGDIERGLMGGQQELSIQQMMKNLSEREARQRQLIDYTGQDWANKMGGLGAQGGWINSMLPYEQFNIQFPAEYGLQNRQLGLQSRGLEDQIAGGWFDRLMNWQGQQGGQYYGGQQDWLGYKGMQGDATLGGYDPRWLQYFGM